MSAHQTDVLHFFDKLPAALPIYEALEAKVCESFDPVRIKVQKSQISFYNKYMFASASLPLHKRKGWPKVCMVVTFGLGHKVENERITIATEPYPGRWTHHVLVQSPQEVDVQLMQWLKEAYIFSLHK